MSDRAKQEELEKLKEQGVPVYSFSRLESAHGCPYEAYLTYVKNMRSQQVDSIYPILGTTLHDCLEDIMNGRATEADLYPRVHAKFDEMEICGVCFPKGRDGSESIKESWMQDIDHFCNTYKAPKGEFETEQFFLYKTPGGNYLQGYIDLMKKRKDGSVEIYDYKSSSMYIGKDRDAHAKQLLLYALAKEQEGYHVRTIAWIFLKYCEVFYVGKKTKASKKDSECTKVIERRRLIKDLDFAIRSKLEDLGIEEEMIDLLMIKALETNEFPEQVRDQFVIKPHVLKYELSDKTRREANEYFDESIAEWEQKVQDMNETNIEELFPPKPFIKVSKTGKVTPDDFYHMQLCGYRKICPYLQEYLANREATPKEEDDWF